MNSKDEGPFALEHGASQGLFACNGKFLASE